VRVTLKEHPSDFHSYSIVLIKGALLPSSYRFVCGYFIAKFVFKTKIVPLQEMDFVSGLKEIEAEAAIWDQEDRDNAPTTWYGKLFVNFY